MKCKDLIWAGEETSTAVKNADRVTVDSHLTKVAVKSEQVRGRRINNYVLYRPHKNYARYNVS